MTLRLFQGPLCTPRKTWGRAGDWKAYVSGTCMTTTTGKAKVLPSFPNPSLLRNKGLKLLGEGHQTNLLTPGPRYRPILAGRRVKEKNLYTWGRSRKTVLPQEWGRKLFPTKDQPQIQAEVGYQGRRAQNAEKAPPWRPGTEGRLRLKLDQENRQQALPLIPTSE